MTLCSQFHFPGVVGQATGDESQALPTTGNVGTSIEIWDAARMTKPLCNCCGLG